jgi:hypothetical protein
MTHHTCDICERTGPFVELGHDGDGHEVIAVCTGEAVPECQRILREEEYFTGWTSIDTSHD